MQVSDALKKVNSEKNLDICNMTTWLVFLIMDGILCESIRQNSHDSICELLKAKNLTLSFNRIECACSLLFKLIINMQLLGYWVSVSLDYEQVNCVD